MFSNLGLKKPPKKSPSQLFTYLIGMLILIVWIQISILVNFLFQVSQPTICGLNFELKSNLPHLTTKTRGAATVSSVARTKPKSSSSLVFLGACKHFSKTPQICHKPRVGTKKKFITEALLKLGSYIPYLPPITKNSFFQYRLI